MKIFVPGRICLFGEHSDWAGGYRRINAEIEKGYTLICGTDQGIYAEVEPHPTALVLTSTTPDGETAGPQRDPHGAEGAPGGGAARAASGATSPGVAYQVLTNYHVRGLVIDNYKTDLPIKKGLSSSAAICVLTARAFNRVYDLQADRPRRDGAGLPGRDHHALALRAHGPGLRLRQPARPDGRSTATGWTTERAPGRRSELHFVIVDLKAEKDTMEILNAAQPLLSLRRERRSRGACRSCSGRSTSASSTRRSRRSRAATRERLGALMSEAQAFFDRYATPACPGGADRAGPAPCAGLRAAPAAHLGRQGRRLAGRRHRPVHGAQRGRPAGGDRDHRARPGHARA